MKVFIFLLWCFDDDGMLDNSMVWWVLYDGDIRWWCMWQWWWPWAGGWREPQGEGSWGMEGFPDHFQQSLHAQCTMIGGGKWWLKMFFFFMQWVWGWHIVIFIERNCYHQTKHRKSLWSNASKGTRNLETCKKAKIWMINKNFVFLCSTIICIYGLCWRKNMKMRFLWKRMRSISGFCLPACATSPTTRPR